jgi:serine/threonine protein kinase/DNA-directed RNA polymerase subunit RPC12/RpoP
MIAFSCHKCGKQFNLNPEFAGRKTQCSSCKAPLVVPSPGVSDETVAPPAGDKIAFSCAKCGMKFSVKLEFAGRSTKCPTCKEPLVVPNSNLTIAYEPSAGQIAGTPSSLARAGVDGGVTLGGQAASGQAALQDLLDGKSHGGARYVVESEIARGGMGAVLRAVDCDIRREVAVKYLLDQTDAKKKLRFVEEAQITGQLEHPNIVPIHELGVDAEKRIFVSMKMVKGRSLAQILKALRKEPETAEKEYSQGRLLNIFVNICNALAYAHSRGVVHRDLKPANIMVGDFGEVYVMDWGLAKVLNKGTASSETGPVMAVPVASPATPVGPFDFALQPPMAMPVTPSEPSSTRASGKVVTSRELDADLTQEGVVLGTPVYMPPEQAAGKIHEIDERSDIYSMGAILYEVLTLQTPISKEGGFWTIVLRVTQGQIEPPEKKDPQRTRAGKIPPELAAIAMKALAKRKEDRYQTIEIFRKDMERYMEGRSVSAKHDTIREMTVKLVKRNKGASIASAAAAVVLSVAAIWFLVAIVGAIAQTQKAYDAYRVEQTEKREQAKRSVPTFIRSARMLINEKEFEEALKHLDTALSFDENEADARFLRAQLLLSRQDYAAARTELETCLKAKPHRNEAKSLLEQAQKVRADNTDTLLALAQEFYRQKAFSLGDSVADQAKDLFVSRDKLLANYQIRIEAAWPGLGPRLKFDAAGKLILNFNHSDVSDLGPLRGLPLNTLDLESCQKISDLSPLKGMPLTILHLTNCSKVSDLTPLKDMRLTSLTLYHWAQINDLTPLKGMPLTSLNLRACPQVNDLTPLKGMQLKILDLQECNLISDLTPLKGMPLNDLNLHACNLIRDLTPLKDMPLNGLSLSGPQLSDIRPLTGMPLTSLALRRYTKIPDLAPLKGLPLTNLDLQACYQISDLTPLKDMKLTHLKLEGCTNITDLKLLKRMPLTNLDLSGIPISDLTLLKGFKLTKLRAVGGPVKDLSPLQGMPLVGLSISQCPNLRDLTSLEGMERTEIHLPPQVTKGMEVIRSMKTLASIDDQPAEQFWKKWDAAKAK